MLMKVNILSLKDRKTESPTEAGRGLAFLSDFRTYLTFGLL